jgi:hypothetical protein
MHRATALRSPISQHRAWSRRSQRPRRSKPRRARRVTRRSVSTPGGARSGPRLNFER